MLACNNLSFLRLCNLKKPGANQGSFGFSFILSPIVLNHSAAAPAYKLSISLNINE